MKIDEGNGERTDAIAALSSVLSNASECEVFSYLAATNTSNSVMRIVHALQPLLPESEHKVLTLADNLKYLGQYRYALILRAALQKTRSSNGWIHYSLGEALYRIYLSGQTEIRMAIVGHIYIASQILSGRSALARCYTILAHTLQSVSPRDSIRLAIQAATHGALFETNNILDGLKHLGCDFILPGYIDLESASNISGLIGTSYDCGYQLTRAEVATSTFTKIAINSSTIQFSRPKQDSDHYIFSISEKQLVQPRITLYSFSDSVYSYDNSARGLEQFYLFDDSGSCIVDFARGITPFIEDPLYLGRPVAILADQLTAGLNICHFLLDSISRIFLYEEHFGSDMLFLMPEVHEYYTQVFSALNLSDRVLTMESKKGSIQAPYILVSSNIKKDYRHPAHYCAKWAIEFLRSRLMPSKQTNISEKKRCIFISRSDAKGRRVINCNEFLTVMNRHGFHEVILSGMSFNEQVNLFSKAEIIVGVHGAGLTNILFAPSSAAVIEILPPLVATPAYWMLASSIGQEYYSLIAEDPDIERPDYVKWKHDPSFNSRDIIVPVERLENILKAIH